MDDGKKSWADKALELPTIYFYATLGLIGGLIIAWSYWGGENEGNEAGTDTTAVAMVNQPDAVAPPRDFLKWIEKNSSPTSLIDEEMGSIFRDLDTFCGACVTGTAPMVPLWLDRKFSGTGIDRDKLQERHRSETFVIKRWQASDTAPAFEGLSGFAKFIDSLTRVHAGSSDFKIEFKPYFSESIDENKMKIRLVAESTASRECKYDEMVKHGYRMEVTQSTSILETVWLRTIAVSDGTPRFALGSAKVMASEQIVSLMNSKQMFSDFTGSILDNCDAEKQFSYGVDQWSRQIPGIDIMGYQGLAIGDANGDGMEDVYVCQGHGIPNRLLIQKPNGKANDQSQNSRTDILDASLSALFVDIDNDGDQDLVVGTDEVLAILSNDGRGNFQVERRLVVGGNARSLAASDFDNDGDLDLFLCKYEDINRQSDLLMFPTDLNQPKDGGRNVLLRNDEGFQFTDVTDQVGLAQNNHQFTRSCIWLDYDQDGDQDLYVANEFSQDQLWENRDGLFTDVASDKTAGEIARHTSVSVADFNVDGREDLFVATDVPLASLRVLNQLKKKQATGESDSPVDQLLSESLVKYQLADETFQPFFLRAPIFNSEAAQSSAVIDLNNDGIEDLVVTNGGITRTMPVDRAEQFYSIAFSPKSPVPWEPTGKESNIGYRVARTAHEITDLCRAGHSFGSQQRNRCYLNIQSGFANISSLSGFDLPDDARAVTVVDWDQDGDQDLLVTCRTAPQLRIFCNQLDSKDTAVSFKLQGTESNADAIGARLELHVDGRTAPLVRTVRAGSGAMSQSSKRVLFGLPKRTGIDRLVVYWPSGKTQTFDRVNLGVDYEAIEGQPELAETVQARFGTSLRSSPVAPQLSLPMPHRRSLFYPRPHMLSLQIQSQKGQWSELELSGKARLLVFWNRDGESDAWLDKVKLELASLESGVVEPVGIFCDNDSRTELSAQFDYAARTVESVGLDFNWGTLSPAGQDQLKYLMGDWFNHRHFPQRPFALLIDSQQRVCAKYTMESLDGQQLGKDAKLSARDDLVYRSMTSQEGIWVAETRTAKTNRLRVRLREIGYPKAAEQLDKVSDQQRASELTKKAIEIESQGKFGQAQKYFQEAVRIDPDFVPAYVGEGNLLIRAASEQADEDGANFKLLNEAKEKFETALSIYPASTDATMGLAKVAIQQDRRSAALSLLLDFLEIAPSRYEVHAMVGRLYFQKKQYEESAEHLAVAFDHRPNLPHLAADLGFLYLVSQEDLLARKFLRLANRLQPSDSNILRLLAEAEFVTGNFEEATQLFTRFHQRNPSHRRSKNVLAWLLATCPYESRRDGERAMSLISPMVELVGETSPSTLEIYAASFAENGDFERAVQFQRRAMELVRNKNAEEAYSESQERGMQDRLQLYQQKRPYRTADLSQIPIDRPRRIE